MHIASELFCRSSVNVRRSLLPQPCLLACGRIYFRKCCHCFSNRVKIKDGKGWVRKKHFGFGFYQRTPQEIFSLKIPIYFIYSAIFKSFVLYFIAELFAYYKKVSKWKIRLRSWFNLTFNVIWLKGFYLYSKWAFLFIYR